jgi:polyphosphate glucokinase
MNILGIDVGGSGIKGAIVDVESGRLSSQQVEIATPQPATPQLVVEVVDQLVKMCQWSGTIGCGFPAVIQAGVAKTAANVDVSWIDTDVQQLIYDKTGCPCSVVNDADAAGLAEMRFGTGVGRMGTVLVLTLGTGIGSALFHQGMLFPNLELGSLDFKGTPIENYASAAVRTKEKLSWEEWSKRLNVFLQQVERLLAPDLIIIGGGVSSEHEHYFPYLETQAELIPARLFNQAGIVGAASYAAEK